MSIWQNPADTVLRKAKTFDESKIRRHPKGSKQGGKFAPKANRDAPPGWQPSALATGQIRAGVAGAAGGVNAKQVMADVDRMDEAIRRAKAQPFTMSEKPLLEETTPVDKLPNYEWGSYFLLPDGSLRAYSTHKEHEGVVHAMFTGRDPNKSHFESFFEAGYARLRAQDREDGLNAQWDWNNKDTAIYLRDAIARGEDFNAYNFESGTGAPFLQENKWERFRSKADALAFLEQLAEKSMTKKVHWDLPLTGVLRKNAGGASAVAQQGVSSVGASWAAQAHPRQGAGSDKGGEFAPKPGAALNANGSGAMGMGQPQMAQPTLPQVFRMFADESGTKQNHETWHKAAQQHGGFDDMNARILARPLSALQIGPEKQELVMRRAKELHEQVSGGKKGRTTFDTWRYLKAELPFILGVDVSAPKGEKPKTDKTDVVQAKRK